MGKAPQETFAYYLSDLGKLLKETALKVKTERDQATNASDRDYEDGRLMAYREVIGLFQQQAIAFGLSLKEIGLDGIDPDNDLV